MDLKQIRYKLEQQKGSRSAIIENISCIEQTLTEKKKDLRRHEQAREIVKEVGQKTQEQLSFHISGITSLALESVFPDPYELKVEFVQRRNKTECDLYFVRNDNKIDPMSSSGVGAVDVAAFALRIASWSMQTPHTRGTILLDEPFKHLKGLVPNKLVLEMIKEISTKLNMQIIMISDERIPREDIVEAADKVFEVSIRKGISKVKRS